MRRYAIIRDYNYSWLKNEKLTEEKQNDGKRRMRDTLESEREKFADYAAYSLE
jgi:hypothetical protein